MADDDYQQRIRAYARGRRLSVALGAAPLLGVYVLVHTPWLETRMQDHRHLIVLLLIVLPLAWLWALAQGWRALGSRWLGLRCPRCAASLAEPRVRTGAAPAQCPHCAAPLRWPDLPPG